MNGCVISGAPGSGKTNVLALILRALLADGDTTVYIYGKEPVWESVDGGARVADSGADFDVFLGELAAEYDKRSDTGEKSPRVVICVDDFVKFYGEISDESANVFDIIVRCGEECNMYVYITGDPGGLTRFHNFLVKAFESCLANGNAIALGGRLKEHGVLNNLYEGDDIAMSEHEGCVIHGGTVRRVRLAKAGKIAVGVSRR